MSQTTEYYSMGNAKVEFSTDGTTYTDASGMASEVKVDGGERNTASAFTFSGDTPLVTAGKRQSIKITVKSVYTEATTDIWKKAYDAYTGGTALYIRWSPRGGASGNFQFTSASGIVTKCEYPQGQPGGGDVIMSEIVVEVPSITEAAVTP